MMQSHNSKVNSTTYPFWISTTLDMAANQLNSEMLKTIKKIA